MSAGFEQLKQEYIASFQDKIARIKLALEDNDSQALRFIIHQLAGSSGSYGFSRILVRCLEIEDLTVDHPPIDETLRDKTQQLLDLMQQTRINMQQNDS